MNLIYNSNFFNEFYDSNGGGNYTDKVKWMPFFNSVAEEIIKRYNPKTVLDAGCALGYIVEALRDRGVEAYGFDISEYAIAAVREDIKPYCMVHSITEPLPETFPQKFDMVITLEVLEHLFPEEAEKAIKNLCQYTDMIIFSSTSSDILDRTHVNVQQPEYWSKGFAQSMFFRELEQDMRFISPWAKLYTRKDDLSKVIFNYEMNMRIDNMTKGYGFIKVYYNDGAGYCEEKSLTSEKIDLENLSFEFVLPENVSTIRLDILEQNFCVVRDLKVTTDKGVFYPRELNGTTVGEYNLFNHYTPQYYFDLENAGIRRLKVQASVYEAKNMELAELIHEIVNQTDKKYVLENTCLKLEQEKLMLKSEMNAKQQQYLEALHQNEQKAEKEKAVLQNELDTCQQRYNEMVEQNETLKLQNTQIHALYDSVINATCWKITKPVRMLLDFVKSFPGKVASARQIKKIVRKFISNEVCGKLAEPFKPEQRYNVDSFAYAYNMLEVSGWFFIKQKQVESLKLKIEVRDKAFLCDLIYGIERTDVAAAFGAEYINTGFKARVKLEHFAKAKVFLVYEDSDVVSGEVFLQEVYDSEHAGADCAKEPAVETMLTNGYERVSIVKWTEDNTTVQYIPDERLYEQTVDLIIPVYNGYSYLDSLFRSIPQTNMKYRMILVNDKSPDKRVTTYLREYEKVHENVILLENDVNLGFVKSVNRGLEHCENHVVLVNTDIEVPPMWLERLMEPIILNDRVATTTPFTNCGTICSFPEMGKDNELFQGMDVATIDAAFSQIKPSWLEMPTGVGFCMGMNKYTLEKIGHLDDVTFGKGYGEENDWCQRAIKAGYTNVLADNLFVYHKHGGSFLSEEKARLIEKNTAALTAKHPDYLQDVARFCSLDPAAEIRDYVKTKLLIKQHGAPTVILNHNLGGGATSYIEQQKKFFADGTVAIVSYDSEYMQYYFDFYFDAYVTRYRLHSLKELESVFAWAGIKKICINELVTYPKLYALLNRVLEWKHRYAVDIVMMIHDYYPVCPSLNLLNNQGVYCAVPDLAHCKKCISDNKYFVNQEYVNIKTWRENWKSFLKNCDEIRCFSEDSVRILQKAYGLLDGVTVCPHKVDYIVPIKKQYKTTDSLNIGLLGSLTYHKGKKIIEEMLQIIEQTNRNINIVLMGSVVDAISSDHFRCTGKYTPAELPTLMFQNDIDIVFISSICPETFSYTAEEAMKLGMPVASFDIGAPADRIKNYARGLIIEKQDASLALKKIEAYYKEQLQMQQKTSARGKVLFIAENISFASRYRVEHFREQLLILGQCSDFITVSEISQVPLSQYTVIVVYRCKMNSDLEKMVKMAQQLHIKVLYDIDDYVFDYEDISYLDFLQDEEYSGFKKTTERICDMMGLCDGFITSTETLREKISEHFPRKTVFVNRNVASLEMAAWSRRAVSVVQKDQNRVVLGYFSGSGTHNKDFSKIEDVIIRVLEKYPHVYLKTGGVLAVNPKFTPFKNRMIHFDFMDWRKLPEQIASVDINLMPLEETDFHACKSENKWTEAALVGVPTIATLNKELELIILDGENGMLAGNHEEWEAKLEQLIMDAALRERLGENARSTVYKKHLTSNTGKEAMEYLFR